MGLELRRKRNGQLRKYWYGAYTDEYGKRKAVNLGIKWQGTPPLRGEHGDDGDNVFEHSRTRAAVELDKFVDEASRKGRAEHLTEKLIESKTGRRLEYVRIDQLPKRWRGLARESKPSERHLQRCDTHLLRFIKFMAMKRPEAKHLYEVTDLDAADYTNSCRDEYAANTARASINIARQALGRFLPVGAPNPFAQVVNRKAKADEGVIHRKPFTPEELRKLLDAARGDDFLYPLVVCAAMTGMRLGDVCKLKWSSVDLSADMLAVKTHKTEKQVEIPIFKPLRLVLEDLGPHKSGFVFPDAEKMHRLNPDGLTWRFKKLIVAALSTDVKNAVLKLANPDDVKKQAVMLIEEKVPPGKRKDRMLDVIEHYSMGKSVRNIEEDRGYPRSLISLDLQWIEKQTGITFVRRIPTGSTLNDDIAKMTNVERKQGKLAASVRDWHALRSTFVTLALSAGVPIELVKRITGHATVEVVLSNYFRPGRAEFRNALLHALPSVITGDEQVDPSIIELTELLSKIRNGNASETDKNRFRLLAAKV